MTSLKYIILIGVVLLISASAPRSIASDLSKKEVIKLLANEKNIALVVQIIPSEKKHIEQLLLSDVNSVMIFKLRLIGLEPVEYKWGVPTLCIILNLVQKDDSHFSGELGLSFLQKAKFIKGDILTYAKVWGNTVMVSNHSKESIRNEIKDIMDKFLNAYIEANPRKYFDKK